MSSRRADEMTCEDYDEDGCAWSRRESARIKQIQIGKARPEYQRYIREVPLHRRTPDQPGTPDPRARVSKRQFDRALGDWRRRLHEFDLVPRQPPTRHQQEVEAAWSSPQAGKGAWGLPHNPPAKGATQLAEEDPGYDEVRRTTGRRARALPGVPRSGDRIGKFGPRKPIDSPSKEALTSANSTLPIPPPPPLTSDGSAAATAQQGAVRISLADQLMEMPAATMPLPEWNWYPGVEAAWPMMETPQKNPMMGMCDQMFMTMETPPDAAMKMPQNPAFGQQPFFDEGMLKAEDGFLNMPVESMLPHRLFDSSPAKSDPNEALDNSEGCDIAGESSETSANQEGAASMDKLEVPASPRCRIEKQDSLMPLMSPIPGMAQRGLATPTQFGLTTPTPATPKRPCYVPETPSPERLHINWPHPASMPYMQPPLGALPYSHPLGMGGWGYGTQATEQAIPEFLQMSQMMPMMPPAEGQAS